MKRFAILVVMTFVVVASYLQGYTDGEPDEVPPPPNYSKKIEEQYKRGYSAGLEDGMVYNEWGEPCGNK